MKSLELTHTGVKFVSPSEEELEATVVSYIHEYQLAALCLQYERKDEAKEGTASFTFWLSGTGLSNKEEYTLMHLQKLSLPFPEFVEQLQLIANRAGISFRNAFKEDGYQFHCNAIHRRIIRKK